jgi:hypothetical protein
MQISSPGPGIRVVAEGDADVHELVSAQTIASGIILAIGVGISTIPAEQPNAGRHELSQSILFVKQGSDWKVRFFQSTPVVSR